MAYIKRGGRWVPEDDREAENTVALASMVFAISAAIGSTIAYFS